LGYEPNELPGCSIPRLKPFMSKAPSASSQDGAYYTYALSLRNLKYEIFMKSLSVCANSIQSVFF